MALQIDTGISQYCLSAPAHRYWQGGRCVYYFALDLQSLDSLLPQRVDDGMIREANRRLTPSHAKNIQNYLLENEDWLLGAILLGVFPEAVEFTPYKDENGRANENFGELRILASFRNTMRIFDGQHRRRAIGDLILELAEAKENSSRYRAAALLQDSVPVALYVEKEISSLRQMFSDASKNRKIEANTVTRFDQRNAFNRAAVRLSEESSLFGGRIELERTTVPAGNSSLLSINQLAKGLKATEVGIRGRVSRERNTDYLQDLDELCRRCSVWADEFLPAAREEYAGLVNGEIANDKIPNLRRQSLAFNATFIRIMAGCYQYWLREVSKDWEPLAYYAHESVLTPGSGDSLLVAAGAMVPGHSSPVARHQEMEGAINYIVQEARKVA